MTWNTVPLGEVCEIKVGRTPARANSNFWGPGRAWLSIADMAQGQWITSTKEEITSAGAGALQPVPIGTVLLSFKLSIGRVARAGIPLFTNEAIAALPVRRDAALDESFLARFLKYLDLSAGANRAAMGATLNKSQLLRLPILLPPLAEQKRIAAILDQADEIRAKRRAQLAYLDELPQALFHETFDLASSPLVPLGKAVKWSSGKFLPTKLQIDGPYSVYGGNGVNGRHNAYMFDDSQLIVGRVGANCGVVHITDSRSWVTDNALVGTLLTREMTIEYLFFVLTNARLNRYAATSGQPSISGARIADVPIPVASLTEQRAFAEKIAAIREKRSRVVRALEADDELFAALQHRAFRGEL